MSKKVETWNKQEFLVLCLKELADGNTPDFLNEEDGVCHMITCIMGASELSLSLYDLQEYYKAEEVIQDLMHEWEESTRCDCYPVPITPDERHYILSKYEGDAEDELDEIDIREMAFHTLPKWEGDYGEARKDLCRFLADELEERYGPA